jgi:beta-glucanase (GH16 family)
MLTIVPLPNTPSSGGASYEHHTVPLFSCGTNLYHFAHVYSQPYRTYFRLPSMASKVQDCDCGFTDSHDPTKSVFTSFLAVNFSSVSRQQFDGLFIPATYEINTHNTPYSRNFSASQVQLSETGLDLIVLPAAASGKVPCGQIFSRAATFVHGSYHARIRLGDVPGTVTALFNYKNDSSEVDIEVLSAWDDPTLLYTVKPQIYFDNGNPSNSTYQREAWNGTVSSLTQEFHDWSFVWLPDAVHFGLDANYIRSITTNVPQAPGRLMLSHWSDGNPNYSLGPPTQPSTATVSFLWAVYNDVNAGTLTCKRATSACTITDGIFQTNASDGGNDDATYSSTIATSSGPSIYSLSPSWLFILFFLAWLA